MSDRLHPFPPHFYLPDLTAILGLSFQFKVNPHQAEADHKSRAWFNNHNLYQGRKKEKFLAHSFDLYAGFSFPDADASHLSNCMDVFLWAFAFDDLADEGDFSAHPEKFKTSVDSLTRVLEQCDHPRPQDPYGAMLYDIWKCFRSTASPGACNRFRIGVKGWMESQLKQSKNRVFDDIMSVNDFILLRRETFGGPPAEALIEYSLDLDLPEYIWDHPILKAISEAAVDIMTWPNDLCSFNKEQETGDFQNLVFCIMRERKTDLQDAIDILTDMLDQRAADYLYFKDQVPSFGPKVDSELVRYFRALEYYLRGNVEWCYQSYRYFRGQDVTDKTDLVVPLFRRERP